MNDNFKILDTRNHDAFKIKTFSGFKKTDVINTVLKSIEAKKIEQACYWATESIVSGYSNTLWDKLIIYACKVVHINNPRLPYILMKKNIIYNNQINLLDKKSKGNVLLIRNSQMIRNLFFDIITTLCISLKTKRYDKYHKINEKEDFKFDNIKKRLCAQMNILPPHIIRFNDPDELKVIMNEIFTMCKNKQFGYDRCCFWILWLVKWESLHKKKNELWSINERDIKEVPKKFRSNLIWIIWEIIFEEMKLRNNENITKQINSLYKLFTMNYTHGKRNKRLPIVFNAIGYLTHDINFTIPIRSKLNIFIQTQCNVNKMFFSIKKNEIIEEKIVVKKLKNKKDTTVEVAQDKISLFNEVDKFIMDK